MTTFKLSTASNPDGEVCSQEHYCQSHAYRRWWGAPDGDELPAGCRLQETRRKAARTSIIATGIANVFTYFPHFGYLTSHNFAIDANFIILYSSPSQTWYINYK